MALRFIAAPAVRSGVRHRQRCVLIEERMRKAAAGETLRMVRERHAALEKKYEEFSRLLTDAQNFARLLQAVFDEAWRHDVRIGAAQPQQERMESGFLTVPVALSMGGMYPALCRLIRRLERVNPAVRIERMTLAPGEPGKIEAKMVVRCLFRASVQTPAPADAEAIR